jgi:hypothetical protein
MAQVQWLARAAGVFALLVTCTAGRAEPCEALKAQIDSKIRAAGVSSFTLSVLDVGAASSAKVVGSCERGSKKIVYAQAPAGAAAVVTGLPERAKAKAAPRDAPMLTECRDGSMSVGGACKK